MQNLKLIAALFFAFAAANANAIVLITDTIIGPYDFMLDGQDITVSGCVLNVNGSHVFSTLNLISGAVLTHLPAAPGQPNNRVDLTIATDVIIDPTTKIDVSRMGYNASLPGPGAGVSVPAPYDSGSGGAYGGFGADSSGGAQGGRFYGSLSQPTDWGSAGGGCPSHYGMPRAGGTELADCDFGSGGVGTVYTAPMTALPALAVLPSTPNGGSPWPWVDYIDVAFNLAVDPATFTPATVTITTPSSPRAFFRIQIAEAP